MPLSLNNRKDIVADSISIIKGNRTIDVLETIDAVTGLAPETLNSLEKLATALNNDSGFFSTVSTAINNKADKSTTYTRGATNDLLDAKVDDIEMTNYATKTHVDDKIAALVGSAPNILNTLQEIASSINNDNIFQRQWLTH